MVHAPSCMVISSDATCFPMNPLACALSFTNISISTPCPNASCTIMPVTSGSHIQSYSPGTMGSAASSSIAILQASSSLLSNVSSTSIPPSIETGLYEFWISSPSFAITTMKPHDHITFWVRSLFLDRNIFEYF